MLKGEYKINLKNKTKGDNSKGKKARVHSCMRHILLSCSTFLPSTIKYSDGYSAYRVDMKSISKTKGDNSKSKKASVVTFIRNKLSCPVLHFYQVSLKYSKGYLTYNRVTKSMHNHCQI